MYVKCAGLVEAHAQAAKIIRAGWLLGSALSPLVPASTGSQYTHKFDNTPAYRVTAVAVPRRGTRMSVTVIAASEQAFLSQQAVGKVQITEPQTLTVP